MKTGLIQRFRDAAAFLSPELTQKFISLMEIAALQPGCVTSPPEVVEYTPATPEGPSQDEEGSVVSGKPHVYKELFPKSPVIGATPTDFFSSDTTFPISASRGGNDFFNCSNSRVMITSDSTADPHEILSLEDVIPVPDFVNASRRQRKKRQVPSQKKSGVSRPKKVRRTPNVGSVVVHADI